MELPNKTAADLIALLVDISKKQMKFIDELTKPSTIDFEELYRERSKPETEEAA